MAWIFEPQRDMSDRDEETRFVPCPLGDATIVAVFEGAEGAVGDVEPTYVGDVDVGAFRNLLASTA